MRRIKSKFVATQEQSEIDKALKELLFVESQRDDCQIVIYLNKNEASNQSIHSIYPMLHIMYIH
ncbi:MAG: hypothetical protein MHMPM18_003689 [Marteilia pararefringens]